MQQAVAVVGEWEGVMGNNVFKFPEIAVTLHEIAVTLPENAAHCPCLPAHCSAAL